MRRVFDRVYDALISLKLAIFVILGLAVSLAAGTFIESLNDTPTAQYYVYRSLWFKGVLLLLGLNILFVMVSRYPWKKRHLPFLLAHIGILVLLFGAWVTQRFGLDGSLRITEGETASGVELDDQVLWLGSGETARRIEVPWVPVGARFRPIRAVDHGLPYDLTVDRYLTHADAQYSFVKNPEPGGKNKASALHLRITGGPMRITQDFWLWTGQSSWAAVQMGPAQFSLDRPMQGGGGPSMQFRESGGKLVYETRAATSEKTAGAVSLAHLEGAEIEPKGWRGGVKVTLLGWVADSVPSATYLPAKIQSGKDAPTSAIHVVTGNGSETWLGLGDRAILQMPGVKDGGVEVAYYPRRVILPFGLHLDHFNIERYEGTSDPASYASLVTINDLPGSPGAGRQVNISMNEPLTYRGYTFYQASYEDADPRPITTILSVNRDPGRPWKYAGSLMLVGGTILLFTARYFNARKARGSKRA